MSRKLKLSSGPADDITIIGIACQLKDYRMAFELNRSLHFDFCRIRDFSVPIDNEPGALSDYPFYCYKNKEDRRDYFLIPNRNQHGLLIANPKGTDYLIVVDDHIPEPYHTNLIRKIQSLPQVQLAFGIDPEKTKNMDLLLEDIELHALEARQVP